MGLFEYLPYGNKHGLNLDEMIKVCNEVQATVAHYTEIVDGMESRVSALEGSVGDLQETVSGIRTQLNSVAGDVNDLQITVAQHGRIITSFQETLESIEGRLVIIVRDIETLYQNVERVENESKARDNQLGSRVTLLEQATINPISVTDAKQNAVLFGSDLTLCAVDPDTDLPYGMSWHGSAPFSFSYVEGEGFLIADDYWNSKYLQINTYCVQLSRNVSYDITVAVFSSGNKRDPYHVFTATVQPEYGNQWTYFDNDEEFCVDITPGGLVCLAWRNGVPGEYEGKYIRYISVVEHTPGSEPDDTVHFNSCFGIMAQAVEDMIANAAGDLPTPTRYHDVFDGWFPVYHGSGTVVDAEVQVDVDLYKDLHTLTGNISLFSQYEDNPIANGSELSTTIDVSDLEIPKVKQEGQAGQYVNMSTGEQYNILITNGDDYVDSITVTHSWIGDITPQSNGHFATININRLLDV